MIYCIAGKNNIASNILEYLLFTKHIPKENILVCCNKTDTGKNTWQRSLRYSANVYKIKEINLEDLYNIDNLIFLSLEFDKIINPKLFKSRKLFNIHFSLLPKYKGMYSSALPLLNNEKHTGVTFHYIDEGIDTGPIIAQKKFDIDFTDTSHDIYLKYLKYGTELVIKCINNLESNNYELIATSQSIENSSYYSVKSIDYKNIKIDLNQTAISVHNQIRAFNFREYQIPVIYGHSIRYSKITNNRSTFKPGNIIWQDDDCIMLSTIDYDIVLYIDKFQNIIKACSDGDLEKLKQAPGLHYYLNEKTNNGWTPLIISTYNGFYDIAMFLISQGANIFEKNNNGTNLLMYAKESFKKNQDDRLFTFYYNKGISILENDYSGVSLKYYCNTKKISKIGDILI